MWRVASVAAGAEGRQGRAGVSMVTSERLLMFYRPPGSHPLSQLSIYILSRSYDAYELEWILCIVRVCNSCTLRVVVLIHYAYHAGSTHT